MQKITPYLWFDGNAEAAIKFYTSVFKKSKITNLTRWSDAGPYPKGTVMSATFQIEGQEFFALNGGPQYKFTAAISFFVKCKTQKDVDYYWDRLAEGGSEQPCGWLKDRFGLSWQIIPDALGEYLQDKDPLRAGRVVQAMLKMKKIDVKALERAYAGK